jgi:hypothetical protein
MKKIRLYANILLIISMLVSPVAYRFNLNETLVSVISFIMLLISLFITLSLSVKYIALKFKH